MRLISLIFASLLATPALSCGPDTDCALGERHYRIAMPDGHDGTTAVGAIVFAHGYRGSARGIMRNQNLRRMVSDMGLALIAVKSASDDWVLPNSPRRKDVDGSVEFNYMDAVIADASSRFAIDTDRMMMTGFSAGGMMTWNMACHRPDMFAGFVPISGTFWLEAPAECAGPVANVIHIHGDDDPTVPLAGRPIADTHQGDVMEALDMYAAYGGFGPSATRNTERLACKDRSNPAGDILNFCMFEGGHSFRSEYVKFGWETFAGSGKL
ncbi:prolyl oligopeptidase family serine peptidase [uncultured Litoreibacter sp.]|uniref:alpha/beta hydrolase family esterase n=1 Tax=uncultured Litoreibacter sp. TaxID=1392394 RepID=UPI0026316413|nr:prolyl oligopeptidase family serine peptidase [uncultured Litoreibacter sp.]